MNDATAQGVGAVEEKISLADVLGADIFSIPELRFELLPEMAGTFKVLKGETDTLGDEDTPVIAITHRVIGVDAVIGNPDVVGTPESYLDKEHRETFFIRKAEDIGRFRAYLADIGVGITGPTQVSQILTALGQYQPEFPGKIIHRKSTKDKEKIFARLVPVVAKPGAAAAPAASPAPVAPTPPPASAAAAPGGFKMGGAV